MLHHITFDTTEIRSKNQLIKIDTPIQSQYSTNGRDTPQFGISVEFESCTNRNTSHAQLLRKESRLEIEI